MHMVSNCVRARLDMTATEEGVALVSIKTSLVSKSGLIKGSGGRRFLMMDKVIGW